MDTPRNPSPVSRLTGQVDLAALKQIGTPGSAAEEHCIPISKPDTAHKSRIGMIETIWHQVPGLTPIVLDTRLVDWSTSDEQPYSRRVKVKTDHWTGINLGWLDNQPIFAVVIKNTSDVPLLLSFTKDPPVPVLVIRPGHSFKGTPNGGIQEWSIRIKSDTDTNTNTDTYVSITVLPA